MLAKAFNNIFSSHFRTQNLQSQLMRSSRHGILRLSPSRSFTNSTSNSANSTTSTKASSKKSTFYSNLKNIKRPVAVWLPATKLIVAGIAIFLSGDFANAWYQNEYNKNLLKNTIEKGTQPVTDILDNEFIPRTLLIKRFKEILQPDKDQSFYHVICGEKGTGKTTLATAASREVGQGVIYVDVPENLEFFGESFGKAINFTFKEKISLLTRLKRKFLSETQEKENMNLPKWMRAKRAFEDVAQSYKVNHNKPSVIIFDNVDRLKNHPEIIDSLQDSAMKKAKQNKYITVFISTKGPVLERMESCGTSSQVLEKLEIGNLSESESKDYLIKKCTAENLQFEKTTRKCMINDDEVNKLYKLAGGRILDLKREVNKFLHGKIFEETKKEVMDNVENEVRAAHLFPNQKYYKIGKPIIKTLLNSKEMCYLDFRSAFYTIGDVEKVLEEVLACNVFEYHPGKHIVTFKSPSVEYYFKEKADVFIKNNV
ncbi:hypothetical protein RhiirC2_792882 [Rhizophagus irregularis]|uniref:AAA+ ATPase domain-containing protein n=1 Tax=Rhizophagus irregularis TaxID=588596 RepID=A0A2N1MGP4_9GLOM|nr:hypothetical protein RhiirC2_792882 [Rhizophagus irregularis]